MPAVPRPSPLWLALLAVVPLAALAVLRAADVPLGKLGTFHYRYAPAETITLRLEMVPIALAAAGLLAFALRLLARDPSRRFVARSLIAAGVLTLWVWTYAAPPAHQSQHVFNFRSPSHDGAFVLEAEYLRTVGWREYLHAFPQRAQTPRAEMKGTRVISNPPGATLLAAAVAWSNAHLPAARRLADWLIGPEARDLPPEHLRTTRVALLTAIAFHTLTLLALLPLFAAARVFCSESAAHAFAVSCVFAPGAILFAPGKDPAQLLTVGLALWLWLRACHESGVAGPRYAALASVAAIVGISLGLVHIWIALLVLLATLTAATRGALAPLLKRVIAPAVLGAAAALAVYWLAGLNLVAVVLSVADAQASVTRGPDAMPWFWQLLGIPLFVLFAPLLLWWTLLQSHSTARHTNEAPARRAHPPANSRATETPADNPTNHRTTSLLDPRRFGGVLLVATALLLLTTSAFTNAENPRLWLPFVPLLLLGAWLRASELRVPRGRVATLLACAAALQIAVAASQWALMDMREAEYRLLLDEQDDARMFN